ncbi:MAG: DUF6035 family protein [bacterium]|nr:DUF6035 family protein [bacterium]
MTFERTIKEAFDKLSSEILKADEIFDDNKDAFLVRKQFHKEEIELYCLECQQKLNVSTSKYDRLHFKHNPNASFCLLKDGKLSPDEIEKFYTIYRSKESERHKYLKNQIGIKLSQLGDVSNVQIDDKFIFDNVEKRKPDVYCQYLDKEIVFEIQLSDLSLRYIISRHEFYQRKGIYLIWILDNFNVEGRKQTERDIKYLTEYQNFFKVDEHSEQFRLICKYKFPFLTEHNKLLNKWKSKSVALSQIKFDQVTTQAYYFDFDKKTKKRKQQQLQREWELEEQEKLVQRELKKKSANEKSQAIVNALSENWKSKSFSYSQVKRDIEILSEYELSILNNSEAFNANNGHPKIHHWFKIAKEEHIHFLHFILECDQLKIDYNLISEDHKTIIQTLIENKNLPSKSYLIKQILKKGYIFKNSDSQYLDNLQLHPKEIEALKILCQLSTKILDKFLIEDLFEHTSLICVIESARRNKIVGFGWQENQWIAFANNAIHSYSEYWEYIELALKHYGIWDRLLDLDKKGSFRKKLQGYHQERPIQNFQCDELFRYLYPELSL